MSRYFFHVVVGDRDYRDDNTSGVFVKLTDAF